MAQVYGYEHAEPITISEIKDEQESMSIATWKVGLDDTMEKIYKMLQDKRWYLEHCRNLMEGYSFHWEDEMCWIASDSKQNIKLLCDDGAEPELDDRIYVFKESPEYLRKIAIDFYYCKTYLEKLPNEIAVLEETMAYLYSQM